MQDRPRRIQTPRKEQDQEERLNVIPSIENTAMRYQPHVLPGGEMMDRGFSSGFTLWIKDSVTSGLNYLILLIKKTSSFRHYVQARPLL